MVDHAALGNGEKPVAGHDISSPGLKLFHRSNKDQRREVLCKGGIPCHSDAEKPEDHGQFAPIQRLERRDLVLR